MQEHRDTIADKLLSTLRRLNPVRVVAYNGDDDDKPKTIAVPTRRKKWAQVVTTIEGLPWSKLEFLDRSGGLLGTFGNDSPARELEDIGDGSRAVTSHDVQMSRVLLDVMLKAQREVLSFRDAETTALLQAQGQVLREMSGAMTALAGVYQQQVEAAAQVAGLRAEAAQREAQGDGSLKELIEAAPQLLQLLPVLKGLLASGSPPRAATPPNGAKG